MSHRHWRRWTAVAALALILSFLLFLLHVVAVPACFVLIPLFCIGLIAIPFLFIRWDLLHLSYAPDAPTLSASFQRPPPFRLA
jgi:predicted MFS family arabinose efflux permease